MQVPTKDFQLEKTIMNMFAWTMFGLFNLVFNPLVSAIQPKTFVITLLLGLVVIPIFTRIKK